MFDCTCNTQNSLLLNQHNGDDASQDYWGGLQLNADELSVLNGATFLSVDTILLVRSHFPRMDVSRILANRDMKPGTVKYNTLHSYCQKCFSAHVTDLCDRRRIRTPTCSHSSRQKEGSHVSVSVLLRDNWTLDTAGISYRHQRRTATFQVLTAVLLEIQVVWHYYFVPTSA